MKSGSGLVGTYATTRGGGGAPMEIPMETCAFAVEIPASTMAASNADLKRLFILSVSPSTQ
jgi:hypothetical protein